MKKYWLHFLLIFGLYGMVLSAPAIAAPVPYWTEPGTSGGPSDNPLPPPGLSAGLTVTLNKGAALLANPLASAAFDLAAQYAESWIADPIEMIISVDLSDLGGSLGNANPIEVNNFDYGQLRSLMQTDQTNHVGSGDITDDLPNVAEASDINVNLPAGFTVNDTMALARANAKALGLNPSFLPGGVNGSDGTINLTNNAGFTWDYDPSDGIDAGKYDFFGVALHEIGHIMGFFSTVDIADALMNNSQTSALMLSPLDLFRMAPDTGCTDFGGSAREMTPGQSAVTYLGECTEALMSTGEFGGDGYTASHWKDNLGIGMMDPTFAAGEAASPGVTDLRALDLIGWDAVPFSAGAAVPVPAAIWLFGSGLLGLLGMSRRRAVHKP